MNLAILLKLLHVATAFWLVAGVVGRNVVRAKAEHSTDIRAVQTLISAADSFERRMVRPGTMAVILAGLLTAWAGHWPILGFLQGADTNWVLVSLLLLVSNVPVVIWIFMPKAREFEKYLQEAVAQRQVTPQLRAVFQDPLARAAHYYEIVVLVVVIALMVLKPF
jgi:hypothetical protein